VGCEGSEPGIGYAVNPVPRTYVRGFKALPLQGGRNIHPVRLWPGFGLRSYGVYPCTYVQGVLWYGVKTAGNSPFLYSSDFPHEVNSEICRREIRDIEEHKELTEEDKEAILYKNAKRVYRI